MAHSPSGSVDLHPKKCIDKTVRSQSHFYCRSSDSLTPFFFFDAGRAAFRASAKAFVEDTFTCTSTKRAVPRFFKFSALVALMKGSVPQAAGPLDFCQHSRTHRTPRLCSASQRLLGRSTLPQSHRGYTHCRAAPAHPGCAVRCAKGRACRNAPPEHALRVSAVNAVQLPVPFGTASCAASGARRKKKKPNKEQRSAWGAARCANRWACLSLAIHLRGELRRGLRRLPSLVTCEARA